MIDTKDIKIGDVVYVTKRCNDFGWLDIIKLFHPYKVCEKHSHGLRIELPHSYPFWLPLQCFSKTCNNQLMLFDI